MLIEKLPRFIFFMKVGPHSGLTLQEIIAIKEKEERKCGKFFWGYAGTLCHPFRVTSFAKYAIASGVTPMLVMAYTPSAYLASKKLLTEFSEDGIHWQPLPKGVVLTGCKYAVIGRGLRPCKMKIDINSYVIWESAQQRLWEGFARTLGDYLRGQVNKACAILSPSPKKPRREVEIIYAAEITEPYCVFVR